jgi:Zn finger protein HypA/HybF involved in hydrogenase expression
MDPQETWRRLLDAWKQNEWEEVHELSSALLDWLAKGGFPPDPYYPEDMGRHWNFRSVLASCAFAQKLAETILANPGFIPDEVPFELSCSTCKRPGPNSATEAENAGWVNLHYVPNSILSTALGTCPRCQPKHCTAML